MKTVVGLFSSVAEAQRVKQLITSSGNFAADEVKVVANHAEDDYSNTEHAGAGIGDKVSHFFKSLTGGDEDVHDHYATGLNSGGALLTVKADDDEAQGVVVLLRENGAREIEGDRVDTDTGYNDISAGVAGTTGGLTGSTGYAAEGAGTARTADLNTTGETSIPIVEENLVVGKREVDLGGVRVYSHVVEEPVSADVDLRNEQILVERRPVDRPATAADFTPGERSFEVRATGEEAVVAKAARVVEEVLVGKDSTQHTETVRDSVRHTEVDVEEIPGETTFASTAGTATRS
jgi:uncharacterized protein (TIGR02271 family)